MDPGNPERKRPVAPYAALIAILLLAACSTEALHPQTTPPVQSTALVCRVGPDGGPPDSQQVGDRGIGGTGAPPLLLADRGIGGTGITTSTGLVAVITGFGSVCLGGQEVATGPATAILLDGAPAAAADLRAGQIAIVDAAGSDQALYAARIRIRHEVTGPVQSAQPGALVVAGQRVAVARSTLGRAPSVGDWVAVSGLRDAAGLIHATRIDPMPPGLAQVAGVLVTTQPRIAPRITLGSAELRLPPGTPISPQGNVLVTGRWAGNTLFADSIRPDPLAAGPSGYFGPGVAVLYERFAEIRDGRLVLDRTSQTGADTRRSTVELERRPDGALGGTTAAPFRGDPGGGRPGLEPAPIPSRPPASGDMRPSDRPAFDRGGTGRRAR